MKSKKIYLKIVFLLTVVAFSSLSFSESCSSAFSNDSGSPQAIQVLREANANYSKWTFSPAVKEYTKKDREIALTQIIETLKPALEAGHPKSVILANQIYQDLGKNEESYNLLNQTINSLSKDDLGVAPNKDISNLYMRRAEMNIRKAETTKDYRSIVKNLEEAGELGNSLAYEKLAIWYLNGKEGIPKNLIRSHIYFQKYHYYERYKHLVFKTDVSNGSAKAYLYDYYKKQKLNEQESHPFFEEIESLNKELESRTKLVKKLKSKKAGAKEMTYALDKKILTQLVYIAAHHKIVSLEKKTGSKIRSIENSFFKLVHNEEKTEDISLRKDIVQSLDSVISHLKKELKNKSKGILVGNMENIKPAELVKAIKPEVTQAINKYYDEQMKLKRTIPEISKELDLPMWLMHNLRYKGNNTNYLTLEHLKHLAKFIPEIKKLLEMYDVK